MKKITIVSIMLVTSVLAVSLSGCLGGNSVNNPVGSVNYSTKVSDSSMWMERNDADIRFVDLLIKNDEVIARVTTELDTNESLDLRGIKVHQFRKAVHIYVPSVEPTNMQGNEIVDIKIGTIRKFSDSKEYTVIVNGGNDRSDIVFFRIENGTLTTVKQASVRSITITENEGNVIAVAEISVPDKTACSVDEKNITLRPMHNRGFDVFVPIMTRGGPQVIDFESIYHDITIGNLSQFSNGRYEIELNGQEVSFTIQNGQLEQEYIPDEILLLKNEQLNEGL